MEFKLFSGFFFADITINTVILLLLKRQYPALYAEIGSPPIIALSDLSQWKFRHCFIGMRDFSRHQTNSKLRILCNVYFIVFWCLYASILNLLFSL